LQEIGGIYLSRKKITRNCIWVLDIGEVGLRKQPVHYGLDIWEFWNGISLSGLENIWTGPAIDYSESREEFG
jgi:hypothetical protein